MNKQQTAVEWLVEQLTPAITLQQKHIDEIKKQAKEMFIEQIINANRDGVDMVVDKKDFISGEQYYNETYGGNK
jgi:hypothetical protein